MLKKYIESYFALRKIADDLYKNIQDHYRHDEKGVVRYPINIPANNIGVSAKPYHINAFNLGRLAFELLSDQPTTQNCKRIFTESRIYTTDHTDNPFIRLDEKFKNDLAEFYKTFDTFMYKNAKVEGNFQSYLEEDSLKEYFADVARTLVKDELGYTPKIFKTALETRKNSNILENTSQHEANFWLNFQIKIYGLSTRSYFLNVVDNQVSSVPCLAAEEVRATKLGDILSTLTDEQVDLLNEQFTIVYEEKKKQKQEGKNKTPATKEEVVPSLSANTKDPFATNNPPAVLFSDVLKASENSTIKASELIKLRADVADGNKSESRLKMA